MHARISESSALKRVNRDANPAHESGAITEGCARLQPSPGNQAVLRMLSDRAAPTFAARQNDRGVNSSGAPSPRGIALAPASGGPLVQRQDDGGTGALTSAPTGPAGGGPVPTSGTQWTIDMLDANIDDANNPQCLGTVHTAGGLRFSTNCGNIKGPFCQPAGVEFNVDFFVDATNVPRPAGFTPPTVRVQLIFVNGSGAVTQNIDKKDTNPKYKAAGTPLDPAFGHDFPFSTSESGWLHIHLQLADPDTGTTIDYNDRVTFTVTPCM